MSPFVSLPTATTLSYNYKAMPSTLPPSSLGIAAASDNQAEQQKSKYIVSGSGHAAHPDDIIASCRALQAHLNKMQEDADKELKGFEKRIKDRELAEKRRVAPGWLDSEARILEPERNTPAQSQGLGKAPEEHSLLDDATPAPADDQGAALDRAFGGLDLK